MIATENGNDEMVELLLSSGADVNIGDNEGKTSLHIASKMGQRKLVKLLLSDPNVCFMIIYPYLILVNSTFVLYANM